MKKILVIDDAAIIRLYHRSVLETEGFVVEEAANGYEGLEKAMSSSFDILLIDINMPKMDGYTLLRTIRRETDHRSVPAFIISTEEREHDKSLAYAAGANFYVVKPMKPDKLALYVKMLTGASR